MTFLSEHVRQLYNYPENHEQNYSQCFDGILFKWDNIGQTLEIKGNEHFSYEERYKVAECSLWGIINCGGEKLLQEPFSQEYKFHLKNSKWYCDCDIESLYEKFRTAPENSNILLEATLKLTATLDRSLGNIVLLKEKEVPFLMRDLLLTQALHDVLGSESVSIMQLLMGNVKGLNIRNIAWHGFFSKNEIKTHLVGTLFLLIPSIGNILSAKGYILEDLPRRAGVNNTVLYAQALQLNPFNLDLKDNLNTFKILVTNFPHISGGQLDFWFYAYDLYNDGCYGDAVIIILPLMEHMLRSVYCKINNCLDRKMTAETSEFYITLDVMLEKNYESAENNLINLLGEQIMIMLLDLFSYQHGLRLRDKVSHFEVDINNMPKEIANHIITLGLCIIQHLLPEASVIGVESDKIKKIITIQQLYEPLFHPTSLLVKQIRDVLMKIKTWSDLPRPPEDSHFTSWNDHKNFEIIDLLIVKLTNKKYYSTNEFLQELMDDIKYLKYPTIFRPSKEIELIYLFQRINTAMEDIHSNVTENLKERYHLWSTRQMRSRQRENYCRMLQYMFIVQVLLLCILTLQVNIIKEFSDITEFQLALFIKDFKMNLKYVENVSSLSQANKNRWEEIKNLSDKCTGVCIEMLNKFGNKS